MYDETLDDAAHMLARKAGVLVEPKKGDRTLTARLHSITDKLEAIGFGGWRMADQAPAGPSAARVRLVGNHVANAVVGPEVLFDIWNHHARLSPKDLTFSCYWSDTGRGVAVGAHVGAILRITDLRSRTSWHDREDWSERHFRAQLCSDARNRDLQVNPDFTIRQMFSATTQLAELGITDARHALLPDAGSETQNMKMVPYLVGMYGTMPTAIRMSYQRTSFAMTMEFYIMSPKGLCKVDFGNITLDITGQLVSKSMDIGKLLTGPKAT